MEQEHAPHARLVILFFIWNNLCWRQYIAAARRAIQHADDMLRAQQGGNARPARATRHGLGAVFRKS